MTDRKYTVAEIDAMRDAIRSGAYSSDSYQETQRAADVENRLRTYLAAGVEPEDLIGAMKVRQTAAQQQRHAINQAMSQASHRSLGVWS